MDNLCKNYSILCFFKNFLFLLFIPWGLTAVQAKENRGRAQRDDIQEQEFTIVQDRQAAGVILWWSKKDSPVPPFAASELQCYYRKMSGAKVPIIKVHVAGTPDSATSGLHSALVLVTGSEANGYIQDKKNAGIPGSWLSSAGAELKGTPQDSYVLQANRSRLVVAAEDARGTLYGAYGLLRRQGVRFFAPQFSFYKGHAEQVPTKDTIPLPRLNAIQTPSLKYRRKYVEEGWSFTPENLKQLVDWMAKNRLNVLNYPYDYQGLGLTAYDKWREQLLPALKKRGLIVEVGGHGFQSWLSPGKYPQYYGEKEVFDVTNDQAVQTYIRNVIAYLTKRPEIKIFDAWPPDGRHIWPDQAIAKYGSVPNAEAYVIGELTKAVAKQLPGVKIEEIAYTGALAPPDPKYMYDPAHNIIDIAPYGRSYAVPVYDAKNNRVKRIIQRWHAAFTGDIGIYEYYRKYLFHSLPVVLADVIGRDIPYYKAMGANGLGTYAEPADWMTYELTHLEVAALSWDADLDANRFVSHYLQARYGPAADAMQDYVNLIGKVAGILYTSDSYKARPVMLKIKEALHQARQHVPKSSPYAYLINHLIWNANYALADVNIRYYQVHKAPQKVKEAKQRMQQISEAHRFDGIILHSMWTMRYYEKGNKGEEGRKKTQWIYRMYRGAPVLKMDLQSPKTITAGQMTKLTGQLKNYSRQPATDVRLQLNVPDGWKSEATTPTHLDLIANDPTKPVQVGWKVTPPKDAPPDSAVQLSADIHYSYDGKPLLLQKQMKIHVK